MKKDPKFKNVLKEYHDRMESEDKRMKSLPLQEGMSLRDEFLLSIGEEAGIFINMLIKAAGSKVILEIGTSYGYSTLWLAEAARSNGGKVISLEIDPKKVSYAQEKLADAGLSSFVDFRTGDAKALIQDAEETFDFVLLDIWKELYVPCFDLFYPKLKNKAWVLADNMIFPPHSIKETQAYKKRIDDKSTFTSVLLPIGSGIELSQYHMI